MAACTLRIDKIAKACSLFSTITCGNNYQEAHNILSELTPEEYADFWEYAQELQINPYWRSLCSEVQDHYVRGVSTDEATARYIHAQTAENFLDEEGELAFDIDEDDDDDEDEFPKTPVLCTHGTRCTFLPTKSCRNYHPESDYLVVVSRPAVAPPCTYGARCFHNAKGTCRNYHPKEDSAAIAPARGLAALCRNGSSCAHLAKGCCHFYHPVAVALAK
jgi:hypothetical protein